jgi:hypothetical protein
MGKHPEKFTQFCADIFIAVSAVLQISSHPAFSYFTDPTMAEKPFFPGGAAVTIDIFRFECGLKFLGPHFGDLLPLEVIVFLGGQKGRAFVAFDSAD